MGILDWFRKRSNLGNESIPDLIDSDGLDIENLFKKLKEYRTMCWVPQVSDVRGGSNSWFGGVPSESDRHRVPLCENCGEPLTLFLQLDSRDLPDEVEEKTYTGTLQVFYCVSESPHCESECEAYFPFSKSVVVRVAQLANAETTMSFNLRKPTFPRKSIVGWKEVADYPDLQEVEDAGLTDDEAEMFYEGGLPVSGDKLLGSPYWVQAAEYPHCTKCGMKMRMLFQIDSEDNVPYMFGDSGCAHVFQCPEHPTVLAMGWACC